MELSVEPGQRLSFLANEVVVHVPGAATGQAYCLAEFEGPVGDMPPLHAHRSVDEAFYVLDGALSLFVGDKSTKLAAGEALVAPRGTPHTYRVESERARWLVVCSPAGFDEFVREVAAAGELLAPPALAETAARYGIDVLGPPGMLPAGR
jgi:quercetin dioxygenase-like cupin family protein